MTIRRAFLVILIALPLALAAAWWWATRTEPGTALVWTQVERALGGRVAATSVSGSLASGLVISGFRYTGQGVTVAVDRFEARVRIGFFPLAIRVDDATARAVSIAVRPNPAPGRRKTLDERLASLVLPFELHVGALDVAGLHVSRSASARNIDIDRVTLAGAWTDRVHIEQLTATLGEVRLGARGSLALNGSGPLAAELEFGTMAGLLPQIDAIDATAELEGDLRGFAYNAHGRTEVRQLGALSVTAKGQGTFGGVTIAAAEAAGDALAARLAGEIRWIGGFTADLEVDLASLSLERYLDEWPADHPVSGRFDLSYAAPQLSLRQVQLAVAGNDARLNGSFELEADSGRVAADLDWAGLRWPLDGAPQISSDTGGARLAGTLDDWQAEGSLALASPGLPPGRFSLSIEGDRERAGGEITEGRILGGNVSGAASASWTGTREFSADLQLAEVRPEVLVPDWPGVVSGRVRVAGQIEPLRFDARLDGVHGSLRGWPLKADGRVALADDGLSADKLVIRHGNSAFELSGGMQRQGGVAFSANLDDVGHYLDGVTGDMAASGRVEQRAGEPGLSATVRSRSLGFGDSEFVDTTLDIDATRAHQALALSSMLDDQQIEINVEGSPDDPAAPRTWIGALTGISLRRQQDGDDAEIHLIEPAALELSRDAVRLARACLKGSVEGQLCLEVDWVANDSLDVLADLESIAVDRVNQFVDTGFDFDQLVTGQLRWSKATNKPLQASAALTISPGAIQNRERDDLVVRTGKGEISFDVRDGALLQGEAHLPLPGTGNIDGAFSIDDIGDIDTSGIDGHVDAVLTDISVLRVLIPALDRADGHLEAKVDIGGTAREPLVTGSITFDDGVLEYRPLGTLLTDINLDASFDEARRFELAGGFQAGEGHGTLRSSGNYGGLGEDLVVLLEGRELELIKLPDLEATANPDLRIGFDGGVIRLDGSVLVPHARVSPRSLPATRHTESPDVVVVAGELPVESKDEERSAIVLDGKLEVGFGDDVVVDIDLAKAKVTGTVTYEWDNNLVPVANGRYEISGDVQAYGQVLSITEGTIRFPNVPANNPYLRIRAEREIFGNSQIKTAGILVDGTVKRPTVEPYTEPRTTRERALTLLVTGSDFDMEQGVGAIDFGTYIAPKLFVSYGIGLFDQENVISARYDLGKGFGLKATSGQNESGFDVIYHVER